MKHKQRLSTKKRAMSDREKVRRKTLNEVSQSKT